MRDGDEAARCLLGTAVSAWETDANKRLGNRSARVNAKLSTVKIGRAAHGVPEAHLSALRGWKIRIPDVVERPRVNGRALGPVARNRQGKWRVGQRDCPQLDQWRFERRPS